MKNKTSSWEKNVTEFTFHILKNLKINLRSTAANTSIVTQLLHYLHHNVITNVYYVLLKA